MTVDNPFFPAPSKPLMSHGMFAKFLQWLDVAMCSRYTHPQEEWIWREVCVLPDDALRKAKNAIVLRPPERLLPADLVRLIFTVWHEGDIPRGAGGF